MSALSGGFTGESCVLKHYDCWAATYAQRTEDWRKRKGTLMGNHIRLELRFNSSVLNSNNKVRSMK